MAPISLIVFDLGKVIVDFSHIEIAAGLAERSTAPRFREPSALLSAVFAPEEGLTRSFDEGKISCEEFYRDACKRFCLDLSYEEFVLRWNRSFSENDDVVALIEGLSPLYRLFLLSNTNELHYTHLEERLPILKKMEEKILSYQLGYLKPSPLIFQALLQRSGLPAQEVLYIDDVPDYIAAAGWLGIQGIVFQSCASLKEELKKRGVIEGP